MNIKVPFTRYNLLSNRLSNRFDNRVNVCIHDTTGCQTGCQPVWQRVVSCIQTLKQLVWHTAVSCIQPVVKPVVQPGLTTGWTNSGCCQTSCQTRQTVWQPAVSCKWGIRVVNLWRWTVRRFCWPSIDADERGQGSVSTGPGGPKGSVATEHWFVEPTGASQTGMWVWTVEDPEELTVTGPTLVLSGLNNTWRWYGTLMLLGAIT